MAAQWGDGRYPPQPVPGYPPYMSPPIDPRRSQYIQPVQTQHTFYNQTIFPPGQFGQASPAPPPPPPPPPPIPSVLTPGTGPRSPPFSAYTHRANSGDLPDLFFGAPSFPQPQIPLAAPTHRPLVNPRPHPPRPISEHYPPQIRHTLSAPVPPIPKKPDAAHPPLPPKPSYTSPPGELPKYQGPSHSFPVREKMLPLPVKPPIKEESQAETNEIDEEAEFQRILEQSAREEEARRREEETRRREREDEEMARAMQASLSTSASSASSSSHLHLPGPSSSKAFGLAMPPSPPTEPSPFLSSGGPSTSQSLEPAAGMLGFPFTSSPRSSSQQILDDEEFARRLYEEEMTAQKVPEQEPRPSPFASTSSSASSDVNGRDPSPHVPGSTDEPLGGVLPAYNEVVSNSPNSSQAPTPIIGASKISAANYSSASSSATTSAVSSPNPSATPVPSPTLLAAASPDPSHRNPSPAPTGAHLSMPDTPSAGVAPSLARSSSSVEVPTAAHRYQADIRQSRAQSLSVNANRTPTGSPVRENSQDVVAISSGSGSRPSTAAGTHLSAIDEKRLLIMRENETITTGGPSVSGQPLTGNQYVDAHFLRGVSLGFSPPAMSAMLTSLEGPIPNVISLPYGRAPPFHLKAPKWPSLLKLMARLSNTRLEATVEAMALIKTVPTLRVVINFVKLHHASDDWHVILYMTIDYTVPEAQRSRYRNPLDTSTLPYSYTLSPTPAYLREAADGPMSKWYTVPAPHPTLPINFPDLATYLMNAVDESHNAVNDRSSGLPRLAKWIDTFYPNPNAVVVEDTPSGRGGFMERLNIFGRNKNKATNRGNDDRSSIVTPFVADEWGG